MHPFYSQLTFLWIFFAGKFGSSTNLLVLRRPPHHIISKRVLRQESSSVAASCSSLELLPLGIDVIGRLLWVPREHTRKGTQARTWSRSSCILPYYFYAFLYYITLLAPKPHHLFFWLNLVCSGKEVQFWSSCWS